MTTLMSSRVAAPAAALLLACAAPESEARSQSTTPAPAATAARQDSALVASVDSLVRARVAADSFSGVVLVARNGAPIYQHVTGLANRETRAPNRLDTKFNVGSVDKYFTRIAIRQLQQAGKVRMSDLVGKHIPDYPDPRVRNEVTVQQLYEMTAGIPDIFNPRFAQQRHNLRTTDDFVALVSHDPLLFTPGSRRQYCNGCYVVLGKIVERASGQSYYDYVQRHVFGPAGMKNTGYFERGGNTPNLAVGYTSRNPGWAGGSGEPSQGRRPNTDMLGRRGGSAGGGYSTAEDLLALSRAVLGGRLLNAAYTDSLLGPEFRKRTPGTVLNSGWNGGAPGINSAFTLLSTGHTVIVLANYDPPAATRIGERVIRLVQRDVMGPELAGDLRLIEPSSPRAQRARRLAELLAAGDRPGAEAYLRSLGTPEFANSPRVARSIERLSTDLAPARPFTVDVFEQEGPMTIVWLKGPGGRYANFIVREDAAGRVTGLGLDSRSRPGPER